MKNKKRKLRPVGEILLDLEPLLFELTEKHDLQLSDLLSLVKSWTEVHMPSAIEVYQDDSSPIYYYGPEEELIKLAERLKKRHSKKKV